MELWAWLVVLILSLMARTKIKFVVILCALLIGSTELEGTGSPEKNAVKQVKIKARRFKFIPSRINIPVGKTIEIMLTSQDVEHGFRIVGTKINVRIPARGKGQTKVKFRATEKGHYRFECSRSCGAGHSSMRGFFRAMPHLDDSRGRELKKQGVK